MKTTITEKFDKNGKVVERTTVTEDGPVPVGDPYFWMTPMPILPVPTDIWLTPVVTCSSGNIG